MSHLPFSIRTPTMNLCCQAAVDSSRRIYLRTLVLVRRVDDRIQKKKRHANSPIADNQSALKLRTMKKIRSQPCCRDVGVVATSMDNDGAAYIRRWVRGLATKRHRRRSPSCAGCRSHLVVRRRRRQYEWCIALHSRVACTILLATASLPPRPRKIRSLNASIPPRGRY